jgi:hypothetical protein
VSLAEKGVTVEEKSLIAKGGMAEVAWLGGTCWVR